MTLFWIILLIALLLLSAVRFATIFMVVSDILEKTEDFDKRNR